jgi:hypothetical protein
MGRLGIFGAAAAAALALAAGSAQADGQTGPIPAGGMTIPEVVHWLQDQGYKAEVATGTSGDKYIKSAAEGVNFDIYMYDCKADRCASMQLSAGFNMTKPGLAGGATKINEWNTTKRYIKAYVDSDNDPWAQYDVNLSPGESFEALDDNFKNVWISSLPDFMKFIGW